MASSDEAKLCDGDENEVVPFAQAFLNKLDADDAEAWRIEILKTDAYSRLINYRHLYSLTIDQLKRFTSITDLDGLFFAKWMECRIQEEDLKSPRHMYPTVKVGKNRCNYLSVGEKFRTFSKENGIHDLDIPVRHIVLRSKSSSLPLLSNKADGEQGSHLCNTKGCISKHHLIVESAAANTSRNNCYGILMQVHENTSGVGCITLVKPCVHGRNKEKTDKEQMQDSCRKIRAVITKRHHTVHYK